MSCNVGKIRFLISQTECRNCVAHSGVWRYDLGGIHLVYESQEQCAIHYESRMVSQIVVLKAQSHKHD